MGPSAAIDVAHRQRQREVIESKTLPREIFDKNGKEVLESYGIKFLGNDPNCVLRQIVELPNGWAIKPIGGAWTALCDDQGRHRAHMYNGPFHEPEAHLDLVPRFRCEIKRELESTENCVVVAIYDCGREFHTIRSTPFTEEMTREVIYRMHQETKTTAEAWLTERYPNWKNRNAYWN